MDILMYELDNGWVSSEGWPDMEGVPCGASEGWGGNG